MIAAIPKTIARWFYCIYISVLKRHYRCRIPQQANAPKLRQNGRCDCYFWMILKTAIFSSEFSGLQAFPKKGM